jgi:hypothetical protein
LTTNGLDIELLKASSDAQYFTGPPSSTTVYDVNGYEVPQVGMVARNNGAYSGTVSSTIDAINQCITLGTTPTRPICGLAHSTSSGIANEGGDSGGAVSRDYSGKHYALGTDSAGGGALIGCAYHPASVCYHEMYFTQIQNSLSHYGAWLMDL